MDKYRRRVERGIVELNRRQGNDWSLSIHPIMLDQSDCYRCVVAQLYGSYNDGLRRMETPRWRNILEVWGIRRGFEVLPCGRARRIEYDYRTLTAIWRARVGELRAELLEPSDGLPA